MGFILPFRTHLAMSKDIFGCHNRGRGAITIYPLDCNSTLQCKGQLPSPQQRIIQPQISVVAKLRNPDTDIKVYAFIET